VPLNKSPDGRHDLPASAVKDGRTRPVMMGTQQQVNGMVPARRRGMTATTTGLSARQSMTGAPAAGGPPDR
jgi:hypothetical protein